MKIYSAEEIFEYAKKYSPYYRNLFSGLNCKNWSALPIVSQTDFWQQNSWENNSVLTSPFRDGILFKSGGTTGAPKFSAFTKEEWETFTEVFGQGLVHGGLTEGEKVANIFYSGDLYASFLFILKSFENSGVKNVQFPVTGGVSPEMMVKTIADYGVDTIAGVPTTFFQIAAYLKEKNIKLPHLKRILFGGESMFVDQRESVMESMPGVKIQSIGYASVDAGLLGYVKPDSEPEVHHAFAEATIFEIIDTDTNELIQETGVVGRVITTNLTRKLMPIIRYPAGDLAEWVDPVGTKDRRFCLRGRAEEGARIGPTTLYYDDIHKALQCCHEKIGPFQFQLWLVHYDLKDELRIKLHAAYGKKPEADDFLLEKLFEARPTLLDVIRSGKIHKPKIIWVELSDLSTNARTGKLRRILDDRSKS